MSTPAGRAEYVPCPPSSNATPSMAGPLLSAATSVPGAAGESWVCVRPGSSSPMLRHNPGRYRAGCACTWLGSDGRVDNLLPVARHPASAGDRRGRKLGRRFLLSVGTVTR